MGIGELIQKLKGRVKQYDDTHNFTCDVCGREVFGGERICDKCRAVLPYNRGVICPFCGRREREEGTCLTCKQKPLGVKKARSVFTHEGDAARLVVGYKRGKKYLYRTLAEELYDLCKREFSGIDAIVSVPMSAKRRKQRGYDQAELLAVRLGELWNVPVIAPAVKTHDTKMQKFLSRADREANLKGTFHVTNRKAVKGKTLLIIDDIMTTGATISELSDVLRRAGAKELYAATVTSVEARSPLPTVEKTRRI